MRLKYIKLAGFKSFVDVTKVPFPHQMTCVVGPNGCGKSNVIDAVRWVLGESSAKNLRGDAMTDVIFNGSSTRKPVSQASVELVFDNSSGRIQGEYSNYAEISVKRVVTRDGRSDYYLNQTKCRRRDITDLFLGTGLGPRSYAIIEQGMISRLIESKPQELRVFIEEAAGISKYKERRRETEQRIQTTRDNLDRLSDVRDELGSQLEKLQRQAAAARRYKELKTQERKYKAELQALRWLAHEQQATQVRAAIQQQEAELERWIAEQRGSERGTIELREQITTAKEQLDAIQQRFYQLGNDLTRREHELQSVQQQHQQQQQRRAQLQAELSQLQQTLHHDQEQQQELVQQQEVLQPDLDQEAHRLAILQTDFEEQEAAWLQWQDGYQRYLDAQQRQREELQQVQMQRQQLEHQLQRTQDDLARIEHELVTVLQQQQQFTDAEAQQRLYELEQRQQQLQQALSDSQAAVSAAEQTYEELLEQRDHLQQGKQRLLGRQTSLQHLLQAAQAKDWPAQVKQWLIDQHIEPLGQVRDLLQCQPHWQFAIEQIASPWLDAWVIDHAPSHWPDSLGAKLVVLQAQIGASESLAAQVIGPLQRWGLLCETRCVEVVNNDQVLPQQPTINPDGQWWSLSGYQAPQVKADDSQLALQQELIEVTAELTELEQVLMQGQQQLHEHKTMLEQLQQQREALVQDYRECAAQLASLQEKYHWQQQQHTELLVRQNQLEQQQIDLVEQRETLQVQLLEVAERIELFTTQQQQQPPEDWHQRREQLTAARQQARVALEQAQQQHQQLLMQMQQLHHQQQHMAALIQRTQQQLELVQEQMATLQHPDESYPEQAELLALQIDELLQQREQVDDERRQWANRVSELETQLRELSTGAQGVQSQIDKARARLQSSQMELVTLQERSRHVLAVLDEMQQPLKPVLEQLSESANEKQWHAELERIQQAVQRLGAINLAAIEEAEVLAERKTYLDQQHEDLTASLETLETAIRKIDRETRQRFKATFDAVNQGLQELFPKVFGGGSAYLELTDDDLLDTGVTIMARPPGKKNSTIHLLSGGEKALTALSLVFAIFRLNPAPFCLLDEVDAPLDDANVGRFCRLVEEMSATVQFIYISHNKIAMEMASHLAGVTMQEAGVSRLVAVDIDEAVALTEAS